MSVRIVFLGGLGEIGRNCFCLEVDGRILVVDCGIMFPDADMPGIDLVLPDFTYLRDNADRVEAVILTHAHEDHAGGLAFLLRDVSVPIYGSALSLALARNRIEEAGMLDRTELITVADGERRRIGPIDCQFIPVTHSVPHGFAVAYFTPEGTIVHTGDFKLDLTPVDGRHTDLALLGELARTRRRHPPPALRLDQRRAARASRRRRRRSARRCARCSASTPTSGSSSRASRRTCTGWSRSRRPRSRTVARSRSSAVRWCRTSRWRASAASSTCPTYAVIDIEETARYAPGEVCIICTGSQGEPMSALSLMAAHEHKHVKISRDDVVVISAHAIPGQRVERVARDRLAVPRRRRGRARPRRRRCTCRGTRRRKS